MTAPFDGTTTYLLRSTAFTGATNNKVFTFSTWFKTSDSDGVILQGSNSSDTGLFTVETASSSVRITVSNASTTIWQATTASTAADGNWHHVGISLNAADTTAAAGLIYLDGSASETEVTAVSDLSIPWTSATKWAIGATTAGGTFYDGLLHDIYLDWSNYTDLSDVDKLKFFISSDNQGGFTPDTSTLYAPQVIPSGRKPVGYGHDGSFPTGTKPVLYMSGGWKKNRGTGGDLTLQGSWEDIMNEGDTTGKGARATGQPENPNAYRLASRPGEMAPERWFDSEKSGMSAKRSETFIEKRAGHPDIGKRLRQKDEDDAETRDLTSLRQQWSSLIRPNEEDSLERLPGE